MIGTRIARVAALVALALLPVSCGEDGGTAGSSEPITLYTCVNEETVLPVIEDFESSNPGSQVELFRAPTADLNARVAADIRSGGLRADVIWACDPLTMQDYVDQDLVGGWTPEDTSGIPDRYQSTDYVGAAVLYIVAVHRDGVAAPKTWQDLTRPELADAVAVPDPNFAASALGALGYFATAEGYGLDFYSALADNGAVQVSSPDEVTTGVAQGVYKAGITIANSAYLAQEQGSPIGVAWPRPGAIAVYGPIALATTSADNAVAQDFITYVTSEQGQTTLGGAGSYPTMEGVAGPTLPADAPLVFPDWPAIADQKDKLLEDYSQIFGG